MSEEPLFDLSTDWEVVSVGKAVARGGGNVQTGPFGSQLHAADYVPTGVPSVMPQNIGDNRIISEGIARITEADARRLEKYRLRQGDIVYSRRGDVERRSLVRLENDGWLCGTGCLRVRFGSGHVVPEYAAYYLGHPAVRQYILANSVGATMPNLNTAILTALPFVLPPLAQQQAIANILSTLDDKIELNRRSNRTLEQLAQSIFRDWFVDFGPIRRRMEGSADALVILGGLISDPTRSAGVAALFPDRLGDDGLPAGWVKESIGSLADVVGGSTPSTDVGEYWNEGSHAWATPKDLSKLDGLYLFDTERTVSDAGLTKTGSGLSPTGSVLLSSRAPIGYLAIASIPVAVNQGFIVLRPTSAVPTAMAYFWCKTNMELIKANANGSTFQEISKRSFRPLPALKVPSDLLAAFEALAGPIMSLIEQREAENRTLREMRDFLLPLLLSGKVRVAEVERMSD